MGRVIVIGFAVALVLSLASTALGGGGRIAPRHPFVSEAQLKAAYAALPLSFEANQGQTDPLVKFLSHGPGYTLFLTPTEAVLVLPSPAASSGQAGGGGDAMRPARDVVLMRLGDASPDPEIVGLDVLPGTANYFRGTDARQWRTNVPTYGRVMYRDVYPGIDLVYYGNRRQLEYDFIVAPGADPTSIKLAFESGAGPDRGSRPRIEDNGDLLLPTAAGAMRLGKPGIYQEIDGVKRPITGGYVQRGPQLGTASSQLGFRVAAYDTSKPLIIDPVLSYSTYLGGSGGDGGRGIVVDAAGNAYVTGTTDSMNFPGLLADGTAPKLGQGAKGVNTDVFVAKLNAAGSALLYSTYVGGMASDIGTAIAVDADGNAYVTGSTRSADFPTTDGAFDKTCGGDGLCNTDKEDAFVTKLDPAGLLLYSTYLGGSTQDVGFGIAVDNQGNAYVTGTTICPGGSCIMFDNDFPVTSGAFQTVDPHLDAFVTKLSTNNSNTNAPCTISGLQYNDCADLLYSTYLGDIGQDDVGYDIAVDNQGNVAVAGYSQAGNFPTKNAFQAGKSGNRDAFVVKLKPDNSNTNAPCAISGVQYNDCSDLLYSTYLGGNGQESSGDFSDDVAVAMDSSGFIYVTGHTSAVDFPGKGGMTAPKLGPGAKGANGGDAFVAKFDPSQAGDASLIYSIYLGGSNGNTGLGIAADNQGNAYVTGNTSSTDFPGPGTATAPKQFGPGGGIFVTKINPSGTAVLSSTLLGGSGGDTVRGLTLDLTCNAYVTGQTFSTAFPTTPGVVQPATAANGDAFVTKIAQRGFFAYIGNFNAGTVSVINTHTNAVEGNPIQVGTNPEGVAVLPDGTKAYVTNLGSSSLSVIDTRTNAVTTIGLGTNLNPVGVAVHPSGKWVYVANSGVEPNKFTHTISVIDTATNTLLDLDPNTAGTQQIELGIVTQANVPFGIAVSPDGTRLFVTNQVGNFVSIVSIDPTTTPPNHAFVTKVNVGDTPQGVAVSPDGARVYVANLGSGTVSVINTANNTKISFPTPSTDVAVGGGPFGVAVHPSGKTVYVTNGSGSSLFVLDFTMPPPALPPLQTVTVGGNPRGVAVTPDGALVYVANVTDGTVSVLSTATNARIDFNTATAAVDDLMVGAGPVALGQFIGVPVLDKDGDGIQDIVDGEIVNGAFVPKGNDPQNKSFTNQHLCGTVFGSIKSVPAGMAVTVTSPSGIFVAATGGAGTATVTACGFDMDVNSGDAAVLLACGSVSAEVLRGPIETHLAGGGVVTALTGVRYRIAAVANGAFLVRVGSQQLTLSSGQSITLSPTGVLQSIAHTTEDRTEDGTTRKKVWTTLRADGGTLAGQPATLPGGIRHVAAVITYTPSCMTVMGAKASPPFTTTSVAIDAANGRVTLTVDIPLGTPAATAFPVDFGRLLLRLTGPATAPCPLTLTGSTAYQPDTAPGSATWLGSAPATMTYQRGDVLMNTRPKSVAQAIAILQYLVSLRTIDQINPVNAASIRADPASTGPDNGDQISTADAILVLRYIVGLVDDSFVAVGP